MDLHPKLRPAFSRLFSSAVFRELSGRGRSPTFARLVSEIRDAGGLEGARRVGDVFEDAFATLRSEDNRDEYIYRAALTHKVLLGTHSLNTACMLTEFRVADCKADVAILNGIATVYEIKSERDSLTRLQKQVETYKRFFARVVVIAGERHLEAILSLTPDDVGVMCLSKRHQITTVRVGEANSDRICPVTVFESLRVGEAKTVLGLLGIAVPVVPNTRIHAELRDLFSALRPRDVHAAVVATLKHSRNLSPLSEFIDLLPPSLQAAALSTPLTKASREKLVLAINTDLREAVEWA